MSEIKEKKIKVDRLCLAQKKIFYTTGTCNSQTGKKTNRTHQTEMGRSSETRGEVDGSRYKLARFGEK